MRLAGVLGTLKANSAPTPVNENAAEPNESPVQLTVEIPAALRTAADLADPTNVAVAAPLIENTAAAADEPTAVRAPAPAMVNTAMPS